MPVGSPSGFDISVFEAVLERGQPDVRLSLARQLVALVTDEAAADLEKEQIKPILLKLASDPDPSIRAYMVEALTSHPALDSDLIFAFVAEDDSLAVPFLNATPALSGWHMLAILRVGDDVRQQAIAARADLSRDARNYILQSGRVPAMVALLSNPAMTFTGNELRAVYTRLGQSAEVVDRLLALPNVPPDVRILHAKKTAVRLRQLMAERGWLAANDAADIVSDSEDNAILKIIAEANAADQSAAVQFLAANSMLTPSLVIRAACRGEMTCVCAFLSHLTGQGAGKIMHFITGRGGAGIGSLLHRSGLPAPCNVLIGAAADAAAEFRNMGVAPDAEAFGRKLLEVLMLHFGAMTMQDQAKQIEFVCRFADPKVRKIARQLKIDLLRAA